MRLALYRDFCVSADPAETSFRSRQTAGPDRSRTGSPREIGQRSNGNDLSGIERLREKIAVAQYASARAHLTDCAIASPKPFAIDSFPTIPPSSSPPSRCCTPIGSLQNAERMPFFSPASNSSSCSRRIRRGGPRRQMGAIRIRRPAGCFRSVASGRRCGARDHVLRPAVCRLAGIRKNSTNRSSPNWSG